MKTMIFCISVFIFTFLKKNLQNLQNLSTILSTVHMCLLLHELTASTSPPHLKHYSLNIKFLWTSFEKHSWSYFFLLFRARISSLLFVFLVHFVKKICSMFTVTPPGLTCEKNLNFSLQKLSKSHKRQYSKKTADVCIKMYSMRKCMQFFLHRLKKKKKLRTTLDPK